MPVLPFIIGGAVARTLAQVLARGGASAAAKGAAKGAAKKATKPKVTPKKPTVTTKSPGTTKGVSKKTGGALEKGKPAQYGPKDIATRGERQQNAMRAELQRRISASAFQENARRGVVASKGMKVQSKPSKGVGSQQSPMLTKKQALAWTTGASLAGMYAAGGIGQSIGSNKGTGTSSGVTNPREHLGRLGISSGSSRTMVPSTGDTSVGRKVLERDNRGKGSGRSGGTSRATGSRGGSSGLGKPKVTKPKKPVQTVSQSRTMWVKKGEMVGGQEVKKGYLAQYGRAEKKVSAKVKIVADTESGKKVGETWKYGQGRTIRQVKKNKK